MSIYVECKDKGFPRYSQIFIFIKVNYCSIFWIQDSWIHGFNLIIEMIQNSFKFILIILYIIIYNIINIFL